jgi:hypothetical protein
MGVLAAGGGKSAVDGGERMAKYRKKPVVIEAVQWQGTKQSWNEIMDMGLTRWKPGDTGSETFIIETLEGDHLVRKGDYVIKGVKGEFYPCKPDVFEATYEPIEGGGA